MKQNFPNLQHDLQTLYYNRLNLIHLLMLPSRNLERKWAQTEIILESSQIDPIKSKLESFDTLNDRVLRILNSNFVKMTFPVFNALFDASTEYFQDKNSELREDMVDGTHYSN